MAGEGGSVRGEGVPQAAAESASREVGAVPREDALEAEASPSMAMEYCRTSMARWADHTRGRSG